MERNAKEIKDAIINGFKVASQSRMKRMSKVRRQMLLSKIKEKKKSRQELNQQNLTRLRLKRNKI